MAEPTRAELDKVRDAIGVYRSCTEADDDYYAAIELLVGYAERAIALLADQRKDARWIVAQLLRVKAV